MMENMERWKDSPSNGLSEAAEAELDALLPSVLDKAFKGEL
jgi:hypothetical protein